MKPWYYATPQGGHIGPVTAEHMHALVASGQLSATTLVWSEGQALWRPLDEVGADLGLPPLPPPLPHAIAYPPVSRGGTPGWVIAIAWAAAGMVLLAILGILAAIALPAYADYTTRSKVGAAIALAHSHQPAIVSFLQEHGRCPANEDPGFNQADSYASGALSGIVFGRFEESDLCGMAVTLTAPTQSALDGKQVWLEYDPQSAAWTCSSDAADRLLPVSCRG